MSDTEILEDQEQVEQDLPHAILAELQAELLQHLSRALSCCVQMQHRGTPTMDWQRRLQQLMRQIQGGSRRSTSPSPLTPVGPVVDLAEWVTETIQTLRAFEARYAEAAREDPEGFPMQRTSQDWMDQVSRDLR